MISRHIDVLRFLIFFFGLLLSVEAHAAYNVDVLTFQPTSDGGKYITLHQSKTLQQWGFNFSAYGDYAFEPIEYSDTTSNRRFGIIDDLIMVHGGAAIGWTNWWQMGVTVPVSLLETFYDPSVARATVTKQTFRGELGDPRVDMKFQILPIDEYGVGLAVVPFFVLPYGKEEHYLGNGMWSPGGMLVFDIQIEDRASLTFNGGYRSYKRHRYDANNIAAVIDDTIFAGLGFNVSFTDAWAIIAEGWHEGVATAYWKNQLQNPAEFIAAVRWTPQAHARGLGFTVGGGRGITTGVGSPDWRIAAGFNFRRPEGPKKPKKQKEVAPEPTPEAPVQAYIEEKIVITQTIHFEFNRFVIRKESRPILDDVAYLLNANPQIRRVRIEGHTDAIGSDAYNQKLSEKRSLSVRDYLVSKGVEPDRLEAVGYGESKPISENDSVRGQALNRRTEFTILEVR